MKWHDLCLSLCLMSTIIEQDNMLRALLLLAAAVYSAQAFSQNAIGLGLVSVRYPLSFWDSLANMTEAELNPEFRRLVLFLDRTRAGDEYVTCYKAELLIVVTIQNEIL